VREASVKRKTTETDIKLYINLDGTGKSEIDTGCGFLNHMLTLFSAHSRFDLIVKCVGDMDVDAHHTAEDVAIALGQCIKEAAGDGRGIQRYGNIILPMDDALILCATDFGARAYLNYEIDGLKEKVGDFDTELGEEFMRAFCMNARITMHLKKLTGYNSHHILEGAFKAAARSLRMSLKIDEETKNEMPSTKGILS